MEGVCVNFEFYPDDSLHKDLQDVENIFYFFLISHRALCDANVQNIVLSTFDPASISALKKYNNWINLEYGIDSKNKRTVSKGNILASMNFIGKAMIILMYDDLVSNSEINKSKEFIFLKFLRNASAHHNKFNMKDEKGAWKLEDDEEIKWRDKIISRKNHGNEVFNKFISVWEVFILAKDISDKLIQQENKKK